MSRQNFPAPKCGHQFCNPHGCRFADAEQKPVALPPPVIERREWWQDRADFDHDTFGRPMRAGS